MIKQIIVLLGGRKFLQQSKSGDMTPPKHPEELLPAKHPPHLHALQAHEKHPYEADVPKLGTPAPATCLTRTHRRCLRGGCFAGREDYHEEAPLPARHVFREVETGQVEDETICAKGPPGECL